MSSLYITNPLFLDPGNAGMANEDTAPPRRCPTCDDLKSKALNFCFDPECLSTIHPTILYSNILGRPLSIVICVVGGP